MILLKRISVSYKANMVINNFTYKFNDCGLYSLSGESGSGKTTLLNTIGGIIKPQSGEILFSNEIKNISKSISYIFQDNNLFENITVFDNIKILGEINNKKTDYTYVDQILSNLGIIKYKNSKVQDLSGGERQRVSIAIALIRDSKVILADEPCASLDEKTAKEIMEILKDISKTHLVIISSHNNEMVNTYSDYIISFPLESVEQNEKDICDLEHANSKGSILSFPKLLKFYFKVATQKMSVKILLTILFAIIIGFVAISMSVSSYSKSESVLHQLDENNIKTIYVDNVDYNLIKKIDDSELNINYVRAFPTSLSIQNFTENESNSNSYFSNKPLIKSIIIDDSLDDNEVVFTDYSLYYLRDNDVLDFNTLEECIGKNIDIVNCSFSFYVPLEIKGLIRTQAGDVVSSGISFTQEEENNVRDGLYSYIKINRNTYFEIKFYEFDAKNIYLNGISICDNAGILIDSNLTGQNISLSSGLLHQLGMDDKVVGDNITINFYNISQMSFSKTFIIEEIGIASYSTIKISPDVLDYDFQYFLHDIDSLNTKESSIFVDVEDTEDFIKFIDIAIEYYSSNAHEILHYPYSSNAYNSFVIIDTFKDVFAIIEVVFYVLAICLLIYSVINLRKVNSKHYQVLMLYGASKYNILLLNYISHFFIGLFSILLGSVLAWILSILLDNIIPVNFYSQTLSIYSFNHTVYSVLIVMFSLFILLSITALFDINKKKRSHIVA